MEIQSNFDRLIKLLRDHQIENLFISEILNHYLNFEVTFSSFLHNRNPEVSKGHLLTIYTGRASIEVDRKENPFVFGYDELLPALNSTKHKTVCVSHLCSNIGTYIFFTDYDLTDLIGILKSKRTLGEIRTSYNDYELLQLQANGISPTYNYIKDDKVFIHGKLSG